MKIHGKEYTPVNERVKIFRDKYSDWAIETNILLQDEQTITVQTAIKDETGRVRSTGLAYETITPKGVNSTSHVENAETSAVGRALGFLGIGVDDAIASADEVQNAVNKPPNQKEKSEENPNSKLLANIATILPDVAKRLSVALNIIEEPAAFTQHAHTWLSDYLHRNFNPKLDTSNMKIKNLCIAIVEERKKVEKGYLNSQGGE